MDSMRNFAGRPRISVPRRTTSNFDSKQSEYSISVRAGIFFVRGQVGTTWVSDASKLPGTERFFAGGDRSVRGFGFNDLSPIEEGSTKVGGRHLATATIEVIRDLPRNLGIAAFVDAGNAFDSFGDPLQYSFGIA